MSKRPTQKNICSSKIQLSRSRISRNICFFLAGSCFCWNFQPSGDRNAHILNLLPLGTWWVGNTLQRRSSPGIALFNWGGRSGLRTDPLMSRLSFLWPRHMTNITKFVCWISVSKWWDSSCLVQVGLWKQSTLLKAFWWHRWAFCKIPQMRMFPGCHLMMFEFL